MIIKLSIGLNKLSKNGIYYFLGNITSHITHAIPLHKELGGTFVVTSNKARKQIEELYNVPVINIDNKPYKIMKPGRRPKLIHEYLTLDRSLKKTYKYLNSNARVIIFYELFELEKPEWLSRPKKVFLTHGNMLKNYMTMHPKRLDIVKDYDYMAALGPYMKQQFINDGIDPDKLLDIGIARTDDVVKNKGKVTISPALQSSLGDNSSKVIVSYMPTFWGDSSIYNTGFGIVRNFPEDLTLIFRPHPQTPQKILKKYNQLIKHRDNIIYLPESNNKKITLVDILNASSVIIGDASSVTLEAILTQKPIIFAHDKPNGKGLNIYKSIKSIIDVSEEVNSDNAIELPEIINRSLNRNIDKNIWLEAISLNFYNSDGNSVSEIKKSIEKIIQQ